MKALSLQQPWAWLICAGIKDVENRDWRTNYRGRVYIHASKAKDARSIAAKGFSEMWMLERLDKEQVIRYITEPKIRGAIIGEVDIIDCVAESESKWFAGKYGFILENPTLYEKPIYCKGALGFFEPRLI